MRRRGTFWYIRHESMPKVFPALCYENDIYNNKLKEK